MMFIMLCKEHLLSKVYKEFICQDHIMIMNKRRMHMCMWDYRALLRMHIVESKTPEYYADRI